MKRLLVLGLVCLALTGCFATTDDVDQAIQAVRDTRVQVQGEIAKIKEEVAKSGLSPEQKATWEAKLQRTSDVLVKVEAAEKKLEERRADLTSGDPGRVVAAGGKTVGEAVGGPYGALINLGSLILGGILTGAYKGRQLKALKADAVEAIGTMSVAIVNGDIPMSDEAAAKLNGAQSSGAKKLVDEADAAYADVLKVIEKKA